MGRDKVSLGLLMARGFASDPIEATCACFVGVAYGPRLRIRPDRGHVCVFRWGCLWPEASHPTRSRPRVRVSALLILARGSECDPTVGTRACALAERFFRCQRAHASPGSLLLSWMERGPSFRAERARR